MKITALNEKGWCSWLCCGLVLQSGHHFIPYYWPLCCAAIVHKQKEQVMKSQRGYKGFNKVFDCIVNSCCHWWMLLHYFFYIEGRNQTKKRKKSYLKRRSVRKKYPSKTIWVHKVTVCRAMTHKLPAMSQNKPPTSPEMLHVLPEVRGLNPEERVKLVNRKMGSARNNKQPHYYINKTSQTKMLYVWSDHIRPGHRDGFSGNLHPAAVSSHEKWQSCCMRSNMQQKKKVKTCIWFCLIRLFNLLRAFTQTASSYLGVDDFWRSSSSVKSDCFHTAELHQQMNKLQTLWTEIDSHRLHSLFHFQTSGGREGRITELWSETLLWLKNWCSSCAGKPQHVFHVFLTVGSASVSWFFWNSDPLYSFGEPSD